MVRGVRGGDSAGRLLVLRLDPAGITVLRSTPLDGPAGRVRARPVGWHGRYEVRSQSGRRLASGWFRLPTRHHALFDAIDGPAEAVSEPLTSPVVWLRIPTPRGAHALWLFDTLSARVLGEVRL